MTKDTGMMQVSLVLPTVQEQLGIGERPWRLTFHRPLHLGRMTVSSRAFLFLLCRQHLPGFRWDRGRRVGDHLLDSARDEG